MASLGYHERFISLPVWRNGSRGRLKIYFKQLSAGSSPVTGKKGQKSSCCAIAFLR
jgi:hypothetical protein